MNHSLVAIWRVTFFFNQCWTRLASFLGNFLLSKSRLHASINSFNVDSDHPEENQTWRIDLDLALFKIIWYRTLHLTIDTIEESTPKIEPSIFFYDFEWYISGSAHLTTNMNPESHKKLVKLFFFSCWNIGNAILSMYLRKNK